MVARNNTYNFNNIGYYHLFYIYFSIKMEDKVEIGWKKKKNIRTYPFFAYLL